MLVAVVGFASLEPPDKQWVSTVYPTGNLLGKFSPNSNPTLTFHNKKKNTNHLVSVLFLVAGVGFEPHDLRVMSGYLEGIFLPNNYF